MFDETEHIINLSLNKQNINFYKKYDKIFIKKDSLLGSNVRGIKIENDKIITQIIINNQFIYLPDIYYKTDKDLLIAIINREKYIELLANKYSDKNEINDILRKKNLPFQCVNNKNINNILNNM
jgi:NhaP-type Na+/H+ and K+/H+ antiporter